MANERPLTPSDGPELAELLRALRPPEPVVSAAGDTMSRMPDMACPRCGADLHPGDLFCGNCGAATGSLVPPAPPVEPASVAQPPASAARAVSRDPEPLGEPRQRRSRGRLVAGVAVVLAIGAIAALSLVLLSTRDDLDNEKAKLAQLEAVTTTTEETPDAGAIGPVSPAGQNELIDLQNQLEQVNAALLQAKNDLATQQSARAADAATQTQQLADLQAQLTQLQAMFPLTAEALAAADATGQYAVTLTTGECTLADCTPLTALSIQFSDATHIVGDRVNGTAAFDGSQSTVSGTVNAATGPTCAGNPSDVSYQLTVHVTAADVADGKLRATRLAGTYTETIGGATELTAPCAGQHRTYTLDLTRQ